MKRAREANRVSPHEVIVEKLGFHELTHEIKRKIVSFLDEVSFVCLGQTSMDCLQVCRSQPRKFTKTFIRKQIISNNYNKVFIYLVERGWADPLWAKEALLTALKMKYFELIKLFTVTKIKSKHDIKGEIRYLKNSSLRYKDDRILSHIYQLCGRLGRDGVSLFETYGGQRNDEDWAAFRRGTFHLDDPSNPIFLELMNGDFDRIEEMVECGAVNLVRFLPRCPDHVARRRIAQVFRTKSDSIIHSSIRTRNSKTEEMMELLSSKYEYKYHFRHLIYAMKRRNSSAINYLSGKIDDVNVPPQYISIQLFSLILREIETSGIQRHHELFFERGVDILGSRLPNLILTAAARSGREGFKTTLSYFENNTYKRMTQMSLFLSFLDLSQDFRVLLLQSLARARVLLFPNELEIWAKVVSSSLIFSDDSLQEVIESLILVSSLTYSIVVPAMSRFAHFQNKEELWNSILLKVTAATKEPLSSSSESIYIQLMNSGLKHSRESVNSMVSFLQRRGLTISDEISVTLYKKLFRHLLKVKSGDIDSFTQISTILSTVLKVRLTLPRWRDLLRKYFNQCSGKPLRVQLLLGLLDRAGVKFDADLWSLLLSLSKRGANLDCLMDFFVKIKKCHVTSDVLHEAFCVSERLTKGPYRYLADRFFIPAQSVIPKDLHLEAYLQFQAAETTV